MKKASIGDFSKNFFCDRASVRLEQSGTDESRCWILDRSDLNVGSVLVGPLNNLVLPFSSAENLTYALALVCLSNKASISMLLEEVEV